MRRGISRRPQGDEHASKRGRFAATQIGYVHIDSCKLRSAKGKVHLFLAIDRVSKFTYVELRPQATMLAGAAFLRGVIAASPYVVHTMLSDNGWAFADLSKHRSGPTARWRGHAFDRVCRAHRIVHKLTRPYHPRTNGQAERMDRSVKEATVQAFHDETLEGLTAHVLAFVTAYNLAQHLKALRWRTRFQANCDAWARDPSPFKVNPHHLIPGPYI